MLREALAEIDGWNIPTAMMGEEEFEDAKGSLEALGYVGNRVDRFGDREDFETCDDYPVKACLARLEAGGMDSS